MSCLIDVLVMCVSLNRFVQILLALVNTDTENASIKEKWITGSVPFVTKRLSALIQVG